MTLAVTSPVTGGAQAGLTSPTYTLTADTAPDINSKQWAVTTLGGTQTGVTTHTVASPFTLTVSRAKTFRSLGKPNPITGLVKDVPNNVTKILVRKGVTVLTGQPYAIAIYRAECAVPAGSDTADAPNLRAAASLFVGALSQQSSGLGDTLVSGILG
jgi:hypothetical protein